MTSPSELVAELRGFAEGSESARATLMRDAADTIERLVADLDARFAESDHQSAKYYQRMRAAEKEMHARELHHFEEEQHAASLDAQLDHIRTMITPWSARIDRDQIGTHAPDCWTYHRDCMILAIERTLIKLANPRTEF